MRIVRVATWLEGSQVPRPPGLEDLVPRSSAVVCANTSMLRATHGNRAHVVRRSSAREQPPSHDNAAGSAVTTSMASLPLDRWADAPGMRRGHARREIADQFQYAGRVTRISGEV